MEINQKFDEIEWLNKFFYNPDHNISEGEIKSVLYFALIWNLFESLACKKFANTASIADKVNELYSRELLRLDDFEPYLNYFQNRYLTDGETNYKFNKLEWRRNDKKELVESVLKNELNDINNIVLGILLIILRLRNNLFHGEKNIYKLNYQEGNFKIANQVLATFLNLIK